MLEALKCRSSFCVFYFAKKKPLSDQKYFLVLQRARLVFGVLIVVSLPFTISWFHNLSSYTIWGFGIASMATIILDPWSIKKLLSLRFWILVFPFLWALIGMSYSTDQAPGWHYIEKQLSLLIFPFFFLFGGGFSKKDRRIILKAFILSLLLCLLVALTLSAIKNYELDKLKYFHVIFYTYSGLSGRIGISAVYLAMYVGFALLLLMNELLENGFSEWQRSIVILVVSVSLMFFFVLLAVKMVFAVWSLCFIALFFIRGRWGVGLAVIASFAVIGFLFFNSISQYRPIKERFDLSVNSFRQQDWSVDPENTEGYWNSLNMRAGLWTAAMKGIARRPIFGPGTGDSDRLFQEEKQEIGFEFGVRQEFNEHNQFLGFWHHNGLIAIILFALMIAQGLKQGFDSRDYHLLVFIFYVLGCFVTENYIEAQKGAIFFGFFFSFFLFSSPGFQTK